MNHADPVFDIKFESTLNEGATNESWGIRNF